MARVRRYFVPEQLRCVIQRGSDCEPTFGTSGAIASTWIPCGSIAGRKIVSLKGVAVLLALCAALCGCAAGGSASSADADSASSGYVCSTTAGSCTISPPGLVGSTCGCLTQDGYATGSVQR